MEAGWHAEEIRDFKEGRWQSALETALAEANRTAQPAGKSSGATGVRLIKLRLFAPAVRHFLDLGAVRALRLA